MSDNENRPTSGYVENINNESDFVVARADSGFTNISECYVSRSGFTRLFTSVRYGKRYMLKCLKTDFLYTPVYHQALLKEFEIGLQLDHPNICRTISMEPVGELGECIVMEYVDGETLEAAVKGVNMTEEKARKIADQLLDAMEYMHAKQTVHRDIKPSNIMLTHRGGDVKLIDFGLSDSETFCVLKIPAGTYGYMAPEQLKPGAQSDPRADIFSFGKVLEYMAGAVHSKRLARIGQKCSDENRMRRPSDMDTIRHMLDSTGNWHVVLNALLVAVALALMVAIAAMTYGREDASEESVPADSVVEGGVNKVVDSAYW